MPLTQFQPDLMSVCLLAVGASLLGLGGLVFGPSLRSRGVRRVLTVAGLAVAAAALTAAWQGQEQCLWLPPLVLAAFVGLVAASRQPWVERTGQAVLTLARDRRAPWSFLLLSGPVLGAWLLYDIERQDHLQEFNTEAVRGEATAPFELEPVAGRWAVTDKGRTLHVYAMPYGYADVDARESAFLQARQASLHLIRTGEAQTTYNCHGWVFAGGQHWVRGEQVDIILKDNGYHRVHNPQPGDVVVLRDPNGAVVHTGLVRGTNDEGLILVESKWGQLGRFIATADEHPYPGTSMAFYHTARGGHLLRGLAPASNDGHVSPYSSPMLADRPSAGEPKGDPNAASSATGTWPAEADQMD